ncbi:gliding motility-associated C-terminal domain-containing protein [Flavobacteriales bacterium]|nr:gliding motility-associated C-terminal domain-containing protein [Flavobacteriales bacterium]
MLAALSSYAQPAYNVNWDNITLSNYNALAAGVTYTLSGTNSTGIAIMNSGTVTVDFPLGTDASTFTSGTYNGSPITATASGNTITFSPIGFIWNGDPITVILNDITNPTGGTYTNLNMSTPNQAADFTTFINSNYTINSPAPVADFSASNTALCTGEGIFFTDLSTNAPQTWSWSFPGGSPNSSSQQNPSGIKYYTPGTYQVELTAANSSGSDTETKTGYIVVSSTACPDANEWTWVRGSTSANAATFSECGYDCRNINNSPPALSHHGNGVTDYDGNLWFFGGDPNSNISNNSGYNDLWKFTPGDDGAGCVNCWAWMHGDQTVDVDHSASRPSSRYLPTLWYSNNKIYLFGGKGRGIQNPSGCPFGTGRLNNLWEYDIATDTWSMLTGNFTSCDAAVGVYGTQGISDPANTPGAREGAEGWTDKDGNLWLFGGYGVDDGTVWCCSMLNDLWKYDVTSGEWTWMHGDKTGSPSGNPGAIGVSNPANTPEGRKEGSIGYNPNTNIAWMFGGSGSNGKMNDIWTFNLNTNEWTWMDGSSASAQPANWGTLGTSAPTNIPEAKRSASEWIDAEGNLWIWGGDNGPGSPQDLWKYDVSIGEWTWLSGLSTPNGVGIYGTMGTPDPNNLPGARERAVSWMDKTGTLWLFGGRGSDDSNYGGKLNCTWKYNPGVLVLLPTVDLGNDTTICTGDSIILNAGGGFNDYQWTTQNTSATNGDSILVVWVSDTISVVVQDSLGQWSDPDTIVINVSNLSAEITTITDQCITHTSVTLQSVDLGGVWSGQGITDNVLGVFDPYTAGVGTFEIYYTINLGSCFDADTISITVADTLGPQITSGLNYCSNEPIQNLSSSIAGGTWSGSGITNAVSGTFDPSQANIGTNEIIYSITGVCSESDTVSIIIDQAQSADINATQTTFCLESNSINLTSTGTGGNWSGTGITNASTGLFNPLTAGVGEHLVYYTIPDPCGDVDSIVVVVSERTLPTTDVPEVLCENTSSTFTSSASGGIWNGAGITDSLSGEYSALDSISVDTIQYIVQSFCAADSNTTYADTLTSIVRIEAPPVISLLVTHETCDGANDGSIEVNINNGLSPFIYLWSDLSSDTAIFDLPPNNFSVTVQDANGCITEATAAVAPSIESCTHPFFYVPNVFSPDGDDINDILYFYGEEIEEVKFMVFNRWGEKVFQTTNANIGWDGTFRGRPVQQGVYVFKAKGNYLDQSKLDEHGNITIIR